MEHSIFRIIDANFNRAREAARVMEEFCRFTLNSKPLSGRAKILRHQLSAGIGQLDRLRLITARDSCRDVGAVGKVLPPAEDCARPRTLRIIMKGRMNIEGENYAFTMRGRAFRPRIRSVQPAPGPEEQLTGASA